MKSWRRSARAEWARSTRRGTRGSTGTWQSKSSRKASSQTSRRWRASSGRWEIWGQPCGKYGVNRVLPVLSSLDASTVTSPPTITPTSGQVSTRAFPRHRADQDGSIKIEHSSHTCREDASLHFDAFLQLRDQFCRLGPDGNQLRDRFSSLRDDDAFLTDVVENRKAPLLETRPGSASWTDYHTGHFK